MIHCSYLNVSCHNSIQHKQIIDIYNYLGRWNERGELHSTHTAGGGGGEEREEGERKREKEGWGGGGGLNIILHKNSRNTK